MTAHARTTFIGARRLLWLWICLAAVVVMGAVYLASEPVGGRNGSTPLGLAYGIIAAAGILFLMWYGIRKRYSYRSGSFTLKSWLGPHVWVGVALALIVPLHTGFDIRPSFHSLSYLLMLFTIASGIWGAYAYLRFPSQMAARREGITVRGCIDQIETAEREIAALARDKSAAFQTAAATLTVAINPSLFRVLVGRRVPTLDKAHLSTVLSTLPEAEYQAGVDLIGIAARRIDVANRMLAEAGTAAKMRIWLYVHLPLSLGCVVAVAAHVFWVVFYRGWTP